MFQSVAKAHGHGLLVFLFPLLHTRKGEEPRKSFKGAIVSLSLDTSLLHVDTYCMYLVYANLCPRDAANLSLGADILNLAIRQKNLTSGKANLDQAKKNDIRKKKFDIRKKNLTSGK